MVMREWEAEQVSRCCQNPDWKYHRNVSFVINTMHSHLIHLRVVFYRYTRGGMRVGLARGGSVMELGGQKLCGEFI